jgi:hypothetical protein
MGEMYKAVATAMEKFQEQYGEDASLEEGDEFVTIFKDGVLIIGKENEQIEVRMILGDVYTVDEEIGLTEGE